MTALTLEKVSGLLDKKLHEKLSKLKFEIPSNIIDDIKKEMKEEMRCIIDSHSKRIFDTESNVEMLGNHVNVES